MEKMGKPNVQKSVDNSQNLGDQKMKLQGAAGKIKAGKIYMVLLSPTNDASGVLGRDEAVCKQ